MRIKLLSKRYAQALFDLAIEYKILEKVYTDVSLINEVFAENRELQVIIDNPVIDTYKKISILNKLFEGKVQELSIKFLRLITNKGREKYISHITNAFDEIYRDYQNILSVKFTTAQLADKKVTDSISKMLQDVTNMNIDIEEKINEDIIGGFIINFQDYQYDASIINQLSKLKKSFSENKFETQI